MIDPVRLSGDGLTYERAIIEQWLIEKRTIPVTKKVLKANERVLVPNIAVQNGVETWKLKVKLAKLGRIIQADQLQNVAKKDLLNVGPVEYSGEFVKYGEDVLISVYPTEEHLQRRVAIMNKLAGVSDPHLVEYFGCCCFGEQKGQSSASASATAGNTFPNAIVTERGASGNLVEYMIGANSFSLPKEHTVMILKQVTEGLTALHDRGIVHRNSNPASVQVFNFSVLEDCNDIVVKLRGLEHAAEQATLMTPIVGLTPPETFKPRQEAFSTASDVWCFGILFWKVYCGMKSLIAAIP